MERKSYRADVSRKDDADLKSRRTRVVEKERSYGSGILAALRNRISSRVHSSCLSDSLRVNVESPWKDIVEIV